MSSWFKLLIGVNLFNLCYGPFSQNRAVAYDIVAPDFNSTDEFSRKPYLVVDLLNNAKDPSLVADPLCRILGFTEGAETYKTKEIEVSRESPQSVVDFLKYGLTVKRIVDLFGPDKGAVSLRVFTKLDCVDRSTGFPMPATVAQPGSALEEKELATFESFRKTPKELLISMYRESQVLAMGESNHRNHKILEHLIELLNQVGQDPQLQYIMLERDFTLAPIYEAASTHLIDDEFKEKFLSKGEESFHFLKGGNFWSQPFFIERVLPLIQEINRTRPMDNPIKVVPIDSETDGRRCSLPIVHVAKYEDFTLGGSENCGFGTSWDREAETKLLFMSKMEKLGSKGKAIVIYHLGHLIQGVEARFPKVNTEKNVWLVPDWHPVNWLGMVLKDNPELRKKIKIVLFDEKDIHFAKKGTFSFVQRLAGKYLNESFGFPLAPFKGITSEKGMHIFCPEVVFREAPSSMIRFDSDLAELADAVVWSHNAKTCTHGYGWN